MIRYRLECARHHQFEAWFRNSADFDEQAAAGAIECPSCRSRKVSKALMTPSIGGSGRKVEAKAQAREEPVAPPPVSDRQRLEGELVRVMQQIRREVEAKAEYVGPRFAEEARKIHYEEAPSRGIYGEATPAEAQELSEEGIGVMPLPPLPEDAN